MFFVVTTQVRKILFVELLGGIGFDRVACYSRHSALAPAAELTVLTCHLVVNCWKALHKYAGPMPIVVLTS